MSKRLPPLNALRVFAAAARAESFTEACEGLHVTQGAVSRQVKQLEAWLGMPLFHRAHRGIELTDAGRQLATAVDTAFQHIEMVVDSFQRQSPQRQQLVINLPPTFATRWLAPRLPDFQRRHVGIDLSITTHDMRSVRDAKACDCVIAFGDQGWPHSDSRRIMTERSLMVCSPKLWRDPQPPRLEDLTLLHVLDGNARMPLWENWCALHQLKHVDPKPGLAFSTLDQVINAAVAGVGVAIVDEVMMPSELASGSLRAMNELRSHGPHGYWFVNLARTAERKALVQRFLEWLMAEAQGPSARPATAASSGLVAAPGHRQDAAAEVAGAR